MTGVQTCALPIFLLYWPAADVWENADGLARMLTVHHVGWLTEEPVGRLARALGERGHAFDYISDDQLAATRVEEGTLVTPGSRYAVLVVPAARRMPVGTLKKIAQLAKGGARVVFEKLPEDVPGYGRLAERRTEFQAALAAAKAAGVAVSAEVTSAVATHARREAFTDAGLNFIRRATAEGHDYFVVNLTARPHRAWTPIAGAGSLRVMNPLDGKTGLAPSRPAAGGGREFLLQLDPGESLILRATQKAAEEEAIWPVLEPAGPAVALSGTWQVEFTEGGPELPPPERLTFGQILRATLGWLVPFRKRPPPPTRDPSLPRVELSAAGSEAAARTETAAGMDGYQLACDLVAAAVLSGNRNFEGRINPDVKMNYLASPPLVVAYAIAGTMNIDLDAEALGTDTDGNPVFLRDIWPSSQEVDEVVATALDRETFVREYASVFEGDQRWRDLPTPAGETFAWAPDSTYVRKPDYFAGMGMEPAAVADIHGARVLAYLGDSVTTDHKIGRAHV